MLDGKCALVTGSTSGIGLAYAKALAAAGCAVTLNGIAEPDAIETAKSEVEAAGNGKVDFSSADMRDPAAVRTMIAEATERMGRIDILINNAGIQHVAPIEDFPDDRWDDIIAINLSAAFHAIKAALPQMRRRDWGRIINTSSVQGLVASIHKAAYVSAKHGLIGLTKMVALETATSGITCNAICPGSTDTELSRWQTEKFAREEGLGFEEASRRRLAEKQPSMTQVGTDQLAALAVFLCGDAASQMTGAALPMDGGWTAQ